MEDVQEQFNTLQHKINSLIKEGMTDLMSNVLSFALSSNQTANEEDIWSTINERDIEIILARAGDSLKPNERASLENAVANKKLPNPMSGYLLKKLIEI